MKKIDYRKDEMRALFAYQDDPNRMAEEISKVLKAGEVSRVFELALADLFSRDPNGMLEMNVFIKRQGRGRPQSMDIEPGNRAFQLVHEGVKVEAAIAQVCEEFGISRAQAFKLYTEAWENGGV